MVLATIDAERKYSIGDGGKKNLKHDMEADKIDAIPKKIIKLEQKLSDVQLTDKKKKMNKKGKK